MNEGIKGKKAYNQMIKSLTTAVYGIKNMRKIIDDAPYNPKLGALSARLYKFEVETEVMIRKFIPQLKTVSADKMLESLNEKFDQRKLDKHLLKAINYLKQARHFAKQKQPGAVWDRVGDAKFELDYHAKKYYESVNEAVEPAGNIKKVLDVAKNQQSKKIGGTLVDLTTANLMTQVWNKVNDKSKEKMNKMNAKQLTNLILKLWDRVGTPRV
jgi:hypothetical protein